MVLRQRYYHVRITAFYYEMRQFYYKIRQLLQPVTILPQNATVIAKCCVLQIATVKPHSLNCDKREHNQQHSLNISHSGRRLNKYSISFLSYSVILVIKHLSVLSSYTTSIATK